MLGSTLILLAVLLAGITLFTGLSWFRVIDMIGAFGLAVYEWIAGKLMAFVEYLQALPDSAFDWLRPRRSSAGTSIS